VKRLNPLRGRASGLAAGSGAGQPTDTVADAPAGAAQTATAGAAQTATAGAAQTATAGAAQTASAGVLQTLRETPLSAHVVLIGIFINQVAAFVQIYLVLFLHARGFSYAEGGFALGCFSVGAIAGTFGGGALSDWLGPRWTIVVSMGATGVFTYALTLFHSLPPIYVAAALSGALSRSSATASAALLFDLVPKNRQVMMSAMRRSAINGGLSVAPLLGAALAAISWYLVFWADAATSIIYCAIAAFVLRTAQINRDTEKASGSAKATQPRTGYGTILRDGRYLVYLLLMLCNGLVHIQFFVVLPIMLLAEHYQTWAYAALLAVSATLGVGLQLNVTKRTQNWPIWLATMSGWVLLVIGRASFGLPGGLVILFIAMLIGCAGQLIGGPAAFAHPVRAAPPGASARYIGLANGAFRLGYAIGPVAGVLLWTHTGKGVWLVCLLVGVLITGPGIWSLREPRPAAAETAEADTEAVEVAAAEMPPPDVLLADSELPEEDEAEGAAVGEGSDQRRFS
jgi:MFS family permease